MVRDRLPVKPRCTVQLWTAEDRQAWPKDSGEKGTRTMLLFPVVGWPWSPGGIRFYFRVLRAPSKHSKCGKVW